MHRVIGVFLLSFLAISIGISSLISFVGHIFSADQTAALIGWSAGSPFQQEIGFANLSIGVPGITCFSLRGNYWVATVIMATIFLWGAVYVHILDIMAHGNYAPPQCWRHSLRRYSCASHIIILMAAYVRTAKMVEKGTRDCACT